MAELDIEKMSAEIESMSVEDLKKQVLDAKVKQRVASKKYYNPESAKKQRVKRAAELAQMVARAKELGIYDDIMKEAAEEADAKLASEEAEEVPEEVPTHSRR